MRLCTRFQPAVAAWLALVVPWPLAAQALTLEPEAGAVEIRFVDTELKAVVQSLGRYLDKPILAPGLPPVRVTLETPEPVARSSIRALLRGLAESHNLTVEEDSTYIHVRARRAEPEPAERSPQGGESPVRLHVLRLRHARAVDVAATVNLLYGGGGSFSGPAGLSTGTLSDELRRSSQPVDAQAPGTDRRAGNATLTSAITLVPDIATNALLIRATEADFEVLREAVEELDIRPLQVLIEVLIVEARRDKSFSLGADLELARQSVSGATIEGESFGAGVGDVIVRFMNLAKGNIDAVLTLAESRGFVEIVSRPVLLASNNAEARFLVGSQRPFIQVSRSLPTDAPSRDQVVQYKDVGTSLTVRPTINQDGYVSLYIQQEINAATSETQFDAPVISTREAVTQVLVKDGQTIVLGGLSDQQRDRTRSGVPILSGIPIIGGIFGRQSRRDTQTELYLFVTPRIIRSDEDAARLTQDRMAEGTAEEISE